MATLIGSGIVSGASNNMQNGQGPLQSYADPLDIFGGNSAQAMDPIGYGVFNALGIKNWDPLVAATNKIPGFHGNSSNTNGVPSVLPNLGAASMIPQAPQGAFQHFNGGGGPYNQMAAQSMGGMMFNPGAPQLSGKGAGQAAQPMTGGKGATGGWRGMGAVQGYPMMMRQSPDKVRQ